MICFLLLLSAFLSHIATDSKVQPRNREVCLDKVFLDKVFLEKVCLDKVFLDKVCLDKVYLHR